MPIVTGPGVSSFRNMVITARFSLASGIAHVFPEGRMIVAIISTDANMADLDLETRDGGGTWREWRLPDLSALWVPGINDWNPFPVFIITDGVNTRILNDGANPIDDIQYMYMEI